MAEEKDNILEENIEKEKTTKSEKTVEKSAEEQVQEEKERYLRLFAEFENYKKRTTKERIELYKTAGKEVISSLLPVLDDFQRATEQIESSEHDKELFEGVLLIQTKLLENLKNQGLEIIDVKQGDDLNTDFHEAITQIPAPTEDLKGKIIDVIETGYSLNEKIIRFAKVVVGQ